jgi:sulfate transport system ATP-binding protein
VSIEAYDISKTFGKFQALRKVSLQVRDGELLALLGPSGSGKTTLLRILAGLEIPDPGSGPILFHEEPVSDKRLKDRQVGFVFQHYALFRHMTVFENVAFGLRVRPARLRPSRSEIRQKVEELLRLVQLEGLQHRYPSQLSGGQRQRVALARALAIEPKVLLLDEPFGALDAKVRQEIRRWLRRLHDELHVTSVFVTHDQDEALEVADRVVVMNAGRVEQSGTPNEVFHEPATEFVINFLGSVNLFHGRVENGQAHLGELELPYPEHPFHHAQTVKAYVRPHELDIERPPGQAGSLAARILHVHSAGTVVKIELTAPGREDSIYVELPQARFAELGLPSTGDEVFVVPRNLRVFVEDYQI